MTVRNKNPKSTGTISQAVQVKFVVGVVLFFLLLFQTVRWVRHSDLFVLKMIEINGVSIIDKEDIFNLIDLPIGKRLFDIDLKLSEEIILENPYVKNVKISRGLPSKILILIEEYEPVALINQGDIYAVDKDGILLPFISPPKVFDLPIISGVEKVKPAFGKRISSEKIYKALSLLNGAKMINKSLYYNISELNLKNNIKMYTADTGTEILLGKGDFAKKLASLDAFFSQYEDSQKELFYIDLRYRDQLVTR